MTNRIIKFRAWNKTKKIMVYSNEGWEDNYRNWSEEQEYEPVKNINEILREDKDCIFMQFIGLTDKNGKEIYENDVYYHIDGGGTRSVIIVEYKSYGFEHNNEGIGYNIDHDIKTHIAPIEIIGNQFENPELLKSQND